MGHRSHHTSLGACRLSPTNRHSLALMPEREMRRLGLSLQKVMNMPRLVGQHLLPQQHNQSPAMTAPSPCAKRRLRIPKQQWQTVEAIRRTLLSPGLAWGCQIRAAPSGNGQQSRPTNSLAIRAPYVPDPIGHSTLSSLGDLRQCSLTSSVPSTPAACHLALPSHGRTVPPSTAGATATTGRVSPSLTVPALPMVVQGLRWPLR